MPGPFVYQNNIPQATDQLSVSQSDILTNFASIESLIDIDHVDFASPNAGQHNQVSFPLNSNAPAFPVFAPSTIGLYSLLATTGVNELYITKNIAGGIAQVPLTASTLSINATPIFSNEWFSFLPSGFIVKGGGLVSTVGGSHTFPVGINIPVFANVLLCLLSTNAAPGIAGYVTMNTVSTLGFTFTVSPGFPGTIEYLVVGY